MRVSRSQALAETGSALSKSLSQWCFESVSAVHDATYTHQSKPVMKLRLQRGVCALRFLCSLKEIWSVGLKTSCDQLSGIH